MTYNVVNIIKFTAELMAHLENGEIKVLEQTDPYLISMIIIHGGIDFERAVSVESISNNPKREAMALIEDLI